ncbi:MAG: glycoside hydrolase, partial [Bacteroidales bacterium]|nr:glycoside hydrolase [Bacteroidales bacterium]
MKKYLFLILALCSGFFALAQEPAWRARWISKSQSNSGSNEWIAFRKRINLDKVPQRLPARIAADTKYWLWINGELAVYEGGLKRGPAPGDGYVDTVDIAPWLRPGENLISILVWHLGRNGFSHLDSGMAALLFEAEADGVEILSDKTWEASVHHGYQTAPGPKPNYRLPESNVRFDARAYPFDWYLGKNPKWLGSAMELGFAPGQPPLGALVERPIPLWKTYGRRPYEQTEMVDGTLVCTLPYNGHFSPFLKVKAPAGKVIGIHTDHLTVGTEQCVRAEYVTREGVQEYEHFCWMNGEKMFYQIPEGVEVLEVGYRETSYDTEFTGSFSCDDPFLNAYWQKSARTLMVCMRDTYYDCPDRERAQWWGDEVNELGMAFYALSPSSWALARKGIYELVNWQKPDGSLHAPVPAGNYVSELPMQMLASVGWYGFHQ